MTSISRRFPNAYVRFKQLDYQAAKNPLEVRFKGDDLAAIVPYADSLRQYMSELPELMWVHSDYDPFAGQTRITLRGDEAIRLGITETTLSLYLSNLTNGTKLPHRVGTAPPNGYPHTRVAQGVWFCRI